MRRYERGGKLLKVDCLGIEFQHINKYACEIANLYHSIVEYAYFPYQSTL